MPIPESHSKSYYCFHKKALYSRGGIKNTVLRNTQPFENNPFMLCLWLKFQRPGILGIQEFQGFRNFRGQKMVSPRWSTLNVISQLQFLIDYPELWHTTSFWSSKTKYGIKNFIPRFFFGRYFKRNILALFSEIFDQAK